MSQSLEKALNLLDHVAEGATTLAGLVKRSGLPKSTAHRLTNVLLEQGYLRSNGQDLRLGHRLMDLGQRARQQNPLARTARPHMEALANATRETIHLGELIDTDIVYLEKVDGFRGLQMRSRIGLSSPTGSTAIGKAMIAHLPEGSWSTYFVAGPPRTPNAITVLSTFLAELTSVRASGFAFDREENEEGICCVAAPVRDATGRVVAAISLSGAVNFLPSERLASLAPELVACAETISRELGAPQGGGA